MLQSTPTVSTADSKSFLVSVSKHRQLCQLMMSLLLASLASQHPKAQFPCFSRKQSVHLTRPTLFIRDNYSRKTRLSGVFGTEVP